MSAAPSGLRALVARWTSRAKDIRIHGGYTAMNPLPAVLWEQVARELSEVLGEGSAAERDSARAL